MLEIFLSILVLFLMLTFDFYDLIVFFTFIISSAGATEHHRGPWILGSTGESWHSYEMPAFYGSNISQHILQRALLVSL